MALNPGELFGAVIKKTAFSLTSPLAHDSLRVLINLGLSVPGESLINLFCFNIETSVEEMGLEIEKDSAVESRESSDRISSPSISLERLISPSMSHRLSQLSDKFILNRKESASQSSLVSLDDEVARSSSGTHSSNSLSRVIPRCASFIDMIKYIVAHSASHADLLDCFLLTYRTFTSPLILLRNLLHW